MAEKTTYHIVWNSSKLVIFNFNQYFFFFFFFFFFLIDIAQFHYTIVLPLSRIHEGKSVGEKGIDG